MPAYSQDATVPSYRCETAPTTSRTDLARVAREDVYPAPVSVLLETFLRREAHRSLPSPDNRP